MDCADPESENDVHIRILIATLPLILPGIEISTSGLTHAQAPQSTSRDVNPKESAMQSWLASAGLGDQFDVIRVGTGPHPDKKYGFEMIEHLELRFKTATSSEASEAERFQMILAKFETDHAMALSEKLFDTFVDMSGIDSRDACVDLHIFDVIYGIYLSRTDGSLVVSEEGERSGPEAFSVKIPVYAPQQRFQAHMEKQAALDPKQVQAAVHNTLKAYFDGISSKGNSKPDITPDTTHDYYLRLTVDGVRGIVTDGYWEHIVILVVFSPDATAAADAAKGKNALWNFVCNVDLQYASSQHEQRKKDADMDYPSQAAAFRTKLVHQLQTDMEKGTHD